jgi:enoyl-CoA hydratase/carnithine racemase
MLLFGETMDARRAHAIGLIDRLCPPGEAIAKAIRLRRAAIRDEVRNRFGDEVSAWPLSSAASDVQRYHDACSLPGAFAEITDALQRPSVTVRTPLDIIREQTREAAALRFQRECVAAANADPSSARCRALKAEANGTGGR